MIGFVALSNCVFLCVFRPGPGAILDPTSADILIKPRFVTLERERLCYLGRERVPL